MSVNVCPIATINAPLDAETRSITPPGHARAGQKIHAQTKALGRRWDVNILINSVDDSKYHIEMTTALPFGITVLNHISCTPGDSANARVSFG